MALKLFWDFDLGFVICCYQKVKDVYSTYILYVLITDPVFKASVTIMSYITYMDIMISDT